MFSALLQLAARHSTLLLVDLLHHLTATAPSTAGAAGAGAGAAGVGAAGAGAAGAAGAASAFQLELAGYVALLAALLDSASFRPSALRICLNLGLPPASTPVPLLPPRASAADEKALQDAFEDGELPLSPEAAEAEAAAEAAEARAEQAAEAAAAAAAAATAAAAAEATDEGGGTGTNQEEGKEEEEEGPPPEPPPELVCRGCSVLPALNGRYERTSPPSPSPLSDPYPFTYPSHYPYPYPYPYPHL